MDAELNRLNSFRHFPPSAKQTSVKLASAGFFYLGSKDEVKCFSCNEKYKNWEPEDSPYAVHLVLNPDCPFVRGKETSTLPEVENNAKTQNMQLSFSRKYIHTKDSVFNQVKASVQKKTFPIQEPFWYFERNRRETIQNLENKDQFENFAAAGFYYSAEKQSFVCPFCQNTILVTESSCYNAYLLHRTKFPDCPFICGIDIGNVTVNDEIRIKNKIHVYVARRLKFTAIESLPSSFPEYTEEADRLLSYKLWPKLLSESLPRALAEAGFFYLGISDMVTCFCCKLTLSDWKTDDKPLTKHLDRRPDCPYMAMIKENNILTIDNMDGSDDNDTEMLSQSSESSDIESSMSESTSQSDSSELTPSDQQELCFEKSEFELDLSPGSEFGLRCKTYLSPDVIQFAQKKGYTQEQIANGILEFLKMSSGFFPDAQALAMTIEKKLESNKRNDELRSNLHKVMADRRKELDICRMQLQNKDQLWRQEVQQCRQEVQSKDQVIQSHAQMLQSKDQMLQSKDQMLQSKDQMLQKATKDVTNLKDENSQLREMLAQLMRENQQLRSSDSRDLMEECDNLKKKVHCKVCLDNDLGSVLLPCKHLVCCQRCSLTLMEGTKQCPTCRSAIVQSVDVYLS